MNPVLSPLLSFVKEPFAGLSAALFTLAFASARADGDDTSVPRRPATPPTAMQPVDLAICLDTSGSMDGLIDAARQKLWAIVNDLALAKPTPKLRVALLTYGNDGHPAESGWVHVDSPFTEDLDGVSAQLFALKTNGGTEYVGRVLNAAATQLDWSGEKDALKIVVVAGNESAEQDPTFDFHVVCKSLIERGVVVNSIYCGNPADELAPAWQQVARCADGQFASIDQQNGTIVISTPFDTELASLSSAINETYLAYGKNGWEAGVNQQLQDANAKGCNDAAAAARACTKGGALYRCTWDLVDAVKGGSVKLEDVKKEELPEKMRELTLEQKQKCVDDAFAKRTEIQKKIQDVGAKRQQHLEAEMKKQGAKDDAAFDRAVRDAIRKQAETKGFQFPKDGTPKPEAPKQEPAQKQAPTNTPEPVKHE